MTKHPTGFSIEKNLKKMDALEKQSMGLQPGLTDWHGIADSFKDSTGRFATSPKELVKWLKKNESKFVEYKAKKIRRRK